MAEVNHCPTCKGTGKQTITVSTFGSSKVESYQSTCITCDGIPMSADRAEQWRKAMNDFWCNNAQHPMANAVYVADNTPGAMCSKHHWKCPICNKVKQTG